jgi:hypothetical protein
MIIKLCYDRAHGSNSLLSLLFNRYMNLYRLNLTGSLERQAQIQALCLHP